MSLLWNNGYYFNDSKYTHTYFKIINKSRNQGRIRNKDTYYESHHVIPYSIEKNNKTILLTAKEHFICHLLLTKMCLNIRHHYKMLNAFQMMSNTRNIGRCTSAIYSKLKKEIAQAKSILNSGEENPFYGQSHSREVREKMKAQRKLLDLTGTNNPNFGNRWTLEQKTIASELKKNVSKETRQKISEANIGRVVSDETKHKLSIALKGRLFSEETREKIRQSKLGLNNPNFGLVYDNDYKLRMSVQIKNLQSDILITKALRIYNPVIEKYGEFNFNTVNLAKQTGLINKHDIGFEKVKEILKL